MYLNLLICSFNQIHVLISWDLWETLLVYWDKLQIRPIQALSSLSSGFHLINLYFPYSIQLLNQLIFKMSFVFSSLSDFPVDIFSVQNACLYKSSKMRKVISYVVQHTILALLIWTKVTEDQRSKCIYKCSVTNSVLLVFSCKRREYSHSPWNMIVIRGLAVNFPAATLGPEQSQKNVVLLVKFNRSIQGKILESQFTQNQQSNWSHLVPVIASLKLIIYLSSSLNQIIL